MEGTRGGPQISLSDLRAFLDKAGITITPWQERLLERMWWHQANDPPVSHALVNRP